MQTRIAQLKAAHDAANERLRLADAAEMRAEQIIGAAKAQASVIIGAAQAQADQLMAEAMARRKTFDDDVRAVAASLKAGLSEIKVP